MAPRVDKEQRRREIAISCMDLINQLGIRKLTVSEAAKTAGIGKGTIYEYFENKDDIVFEIININIENYHNEFLENIKDIKTIKEKVFLFFKFVLDESAENQKSFNGYKEYLSVVLSDDNQSMKKYNNKCHIFFTEQLKKIFLEGIEKKELTPKSLDFVDSLIVFENGLTLLKMTQEHFDVSILCKNFINNLFELIEEKNDK
jgi:AcrR family transcriptional regulator